MKNSIKLICAAAMTAGLFSCAKNETIETPAPSLTPATISVSADGMKATLNGKTLTWTSGDQIAVYQYGKYNTSDTRDASKNIFTFSSGNEFTGTIAGYQPLGEGGAAERYYVAFPAANCSACGITTGKYKISIPAEQTGLLADFAKNATYLGSLNAKSEPVTSYEGGVLTFLKGFNLYCATPVLKFNVPASLNLTKITISLKDADDAAVAASGVIQCRSDAADGSNFAVLTSNNTLVIYNGGTVISGDVYAVLMPTENHEIGVFKNGAKTIIFDLENSSASAASIKLPLTGEITSGTLKNLPSLPTTIAWNLPVGPGISDIRSNIDAIVVDESTTLTKYTRFMVTPEDASSTIKYTSSSESTPTSANTDYDTVTGMPSMDPLYTMFKVSTDGYSPRTVCALSWILNQKTGFGKDFVENHPETPAVGDTYPAGDAYSYGLKFTYKGLGTNGNSNLPTIDNNYFYFAGNTTSQKVNAEGALSFKAPQTGTALVMFHHMSNGTARPFRAQNITKGTSVQINSGTAGVGVVKTETFNVSAGDIIMVDINKAGAGTGIYSFTFLWEPAATK